MNKNFEFDVIFKYFLVRLDILHKIWLGGFALGAFSVALGSQNNVILLIAGMLSLLGCLWGVQWNLRLVNKLFIYLRFLDKDVGIDYYIIQKHNNYFSSFSEKHNNTSRLILVIPYSCMYCSVLIMAIIQLTKSGYNSYEFRALVPILVILSGFFIYIILQIIYVSSQKYFLSCKDNFAECLKLNACASDDPR